MIEVIPFFDGPKGGQSAAASLDADGPRPGLNVGPEALRRSTTRLGRGGCPQELGGARDDELWTYTGRSDHPGMNQIAAIPAVGLPSEANGATANPRAASVRLKAKSMSKAYGQRRHDFRRGRQPTYVDGARTHRNRALLVPRPLPEIRREVVALRREGGARRALKSNAAIVTVGIITFGVEAAAMFGRLEIERQDKAFQSLAEAIATRLGTTLEGLVVHLDETTIHAHFEMRGYDDDGTPISKVATFRVMSELQDLTAEIMGRFCPGIERGHKKWDRIEAGADYAATLNRSVKELHRDLPSEIEVLRAEIEVLRAELELLRAEEVELEASVAKTREHLAKLEAKVELNEKEEKRLAVYAARLEGKEAVQADLQARLERLMAAMDTRDAEIAAEEAAIAERELQVAARESEAQAGLAAVAAVVDEMEAGTIELTDTGDLRMADPSPMRVAPTGIAANLLMLAERVLRVERDLRTKGTRLDRLMDRLTTWLGRDDLPEAARRDGAALRCEVDQDGPDI